MPFGALYSDDACSLTEEEWITGLVKPKRDA